jgi:hypothetical protein
MHVHKNSFYDPLGAVFEFRPNRLHDKDEPFIQYTEGMPPDEVVKGYMEEFGGFISPLYVYIYLDFQYSLTPFGCRFNSRHIGYIHASSKRILEWYDSEDAITPDLLKDVRERIEHELYIMSNLYSRKVYVVSHEKRKDTCVSCGKEGDWGEEDSVVGALPSRWREDIWDTLRYYAVEHFGVDLTGWEKDD